ncbi:hypothetical protein [Nostoc commune]|uniref:hypothetical protein n=1 Tax=Nostoc commune TaxID=1178 RepID=UPI002072FB98|nr:hypothetical protein [Nostoc commune]
MNRISTLSLESLITKSRRWRSPPQASDFPPMDADNYPKIISIFRQLRFETTDQR